MERVEPMSDGAKADSPAQGTLDRETRSLRVVVVIVAALAGLYFVAHAARAIAFPFPLDYGEGPLFDQAHRLARGENIYRPALGDYPFVIANYPPLYPALLAALDALSALSYPSARVVTLLGALASAGCIFGVVRAVTGRRPAAMAAAGLFLGSPYVLFWSTLARVDFVALALSLSAVFVVARWPARASTALVAAALVFLAASTRQSHLLAGPFAIAGALVSRPRGKARAALFVLALAALVLAAFFSLQAATEGGFFLHVVTANKNHFSADLLGFFLTDLALTTGPLLVVAALALFARASFRGPCGPLLPLYLAGAALSALTIGKVGSHVNYLLEIAAAAAIGGGVALARWSEAATIGRRRAAHALVAAATLYMAGFGILRPENMEDKLALRREYGELAAVLAREPGPVLADEAMGMLAVTGHPILLQPFEFTQLARQGAWDDARVVSDLRAQRFSLVLVNDGPRTPESWTKERWTEGMLAALHEAYEPRGALADATLYRPKPAGGPPP